MILRINIQHKGAGSVILVMLVDNTTGPDISKYIVGIIDNAYLHSMHAVLRQCAIGKFHASLIRMEIPQLINHVVCY